MTTVPWVVVRRLALARAVAIHTAHARGLDWMRMTQAARDKLVSETETVVREWVRSGVAIQFAGEYREADDGGDPLIPWETDKPPT
jgi:hypothetical protein